MRQRVRHRTLVVGRGAVGSVAACCAGQGARYVAGETREVCAGVHVRCRCVLRAGLQCACTRRGVEGEREVNVTYGGAECGEEDACECVCLVRAGGRACLRVEVRAGVDGAMAG